MISSAEKRFVSQSSLTIAAPIGRPLLIALAFFGVFSAENLNPSGRRLTNQVSVKPLASSFHPIVQLLPGLRPDPWLQLVAPFGPVIAVQAPYLVAAVSFLSREGSARERNQTLAPFSPNTRNKRPLFF
jgi:hypothetical protein